MHIAVTGAGGFIGRRLVDMLQSEPGASEVRRLGRRRGGETVVVALDDVSALGPALSGCQAVVHCAFDFYDDEANLAMARALGSVCAALRVRLVHLSTAAVYEPLPDGDLTEAVSTAAPGTTYKTLKLAIEQTLLGLVESVGLDLVILQPTIVYGPAGGAWTDSPVRELLTGQVLLPDAGQGLCNAVYVDDVCRAAIAACTAPLNSGERVLVSGSKPVTWGEFLGAYQAMLGVGSLQFEPPGRHAAENVAPEDRRPPSRLGTAKQVLRRLVLARLGAAGRSRVNMILQRVRAKLRGPKVYRAEGAKRALYEARCTVRIDKARSLLGYQPSFDLVSGMAATRPYIERVYGTGSGLRPEPAGSSAPQTRVT